MKVVLEEIDAGIARFIPDNQREAIYINEKDLPKDTKVDQLYDITFDAQGNIKDLKELPKEQKERKKRLKDKREQMKRRKK